MSMLSFRKEFKRRAVDLGEILVNGWQKHASTGAYEYIYIYVNIYIYIEI